MRSIYAITGAMIVAVTDLLLNLLAAAIQNRAFGDQFSNQALIWLVVFVVAGLLLGWWLGAMIRLAPNTEDLQRSATAKQRSSKPVTMTRLRALLSYGKLRGQGIELSDILLFASVLDVDTRE